MLSWEGSFRFISAPKSRRPFVRVTLRSTPSGGPSVLRLNTPTGFEVGLSIPRSLFVLDIPLIIKLAAAGINDVVVELQPVVHYYAEVFR